MDIRISFSSEACVRSIEITQGFISFLRNNHYTYRWPFPERNMPSHEELVIQIQKDQVSFLPERKCLELQNMLSEHKEEIAAGWKKLQKNDPSFSKIETVNCFLTFYGPHGYFDAPNTVYVNIAMGTSAFWLETILHEAIHLCIQSKKFLEHENEESFVDDMFISSFGSIFPDYTRQIFST